MLQARLAIEFIGGPHDGARSYLLRQTRTTPLRYPLEILVTSYDTLTAHDVEIGKYIRDNSTDTGMRYVWATGKVDG